MYIGLQVKCPLFLPNSNETWIISIDFGKSLKCQASSKSVQWELNWFMQTDMTRLRLKF